MHFYNYFNEFKLITIMEILSFMALGSQIPVKNSKSTKITLISLR